MTGGRAVLLSLLICTSVQAASGASFDAVRGDWRPSYAYLLDRNGATPMRYKVTGIPTLLVFKGGQVVEQLVGYKSKEDIQKALDKHVS